MFRPLVANTNVFFIEGFSYGAFRRPAVTTTEVAAGSIKAEQRRPREEEEKNTKEDRGKKPIKQRQKKVHKKKTETNTSSKPRKPTLISLSSQSPPTN